MFECLLGSYSLARIGLKHFFEEIDGGWLDCFVFFRLQVDIHLSVFLVHLIIFGALEQLLAGKQNMENDSSREHITLGLDVPGFIQGDDFGGHVAGGPTAEKEIAG